MRLADPIQVPQNRHATGAFWPYCCAAPDKFDAEEDAERAAFAFWKKSRGIYAISDADVHGQGHAIYGEISGAPPQPSGNPIGGIPCIESSNGSLLQAEPDRSGGGSRPDAAQGQKAEAVDRRQVPDGSPRGHSNANSALDLKAAGDGRDGWHKANSGRGRRLDDVRRAHGISAGGTVLDSKRGEHDSGAGGSRPAQNGRRPREVSEAQAIVEAVGRGHGGEHAPTVKGRRLADIFPFSSVLGNVMAAHVLGLKPQTLRRWAHDQSGPFMPTKAGRFNMWSITDLQRYLDGEGGSPAE